MYVQAMIKEATKCGFDNYLVAGVSANSSVVTDFIEEDRIMFVKFNTVEVPFDIPGMSDIMPYKSTKFCDLSQKEINVYKNAFTKILKAAVEKFKPDIIHSHHLWLVSSIARQLFPKIPFITSCHGTDLRQFQNCFNWQERVLRGCKQIDTILALSEDQKRDLVRLYKFDPEKVIVVGAGFNTDLFYSETKPKPDPVQIVYAGKLCNAKGVPWLLKAIKAIDKLNWKLHLIGDGSGEEKEHCLELAKNLGERVQLYGAIPQKQLAYIFRRSHIFILPSLYEGLPLVVLEALASGCRIIVTDLPGVKEVISESGFEFINSIKTPRLYNLDQLYKEDKNKFEQDLKDAIYRQISLAQKNPQLNLDLISDKLNSFKWSSVFSRIRAMYMKNIF